MELCVSELPQDAWVSFGDKTGATNEPFLKILLLLRSTCPYQLLVLIFNAIKFNLTSKGCCDRQPASKAAKKATNSVVFQFTIETLSVTQV